jgi:hypothetical protein
MDSVGEWAEVMPSGFDPVCMRCCAIDDEDNPVVLVGDEFVCYECLEEGGYFGEHT